MDGGCRMLCGLLCDRDVEYEGEWNRNIYGGGGDSGEYMCNIKFDGLFGYDGFIYIFVIYKFVSIMYGVICIE